MPESELTNKQRAFIEVYLVCWNASEAARRAGYSQKTARVIGQENLLKPAIQAAIAARLTELHMSADEVLARLSAQARGSLADVLALPSMDAPEGVERASWSLDLVKAQQNGAIHLIKRLRRNRYGFEIELYSAFDALVKMGEYHGLFKQVVQVQVELSKLSHAQLYSIADGADPVAVLLGRLSRQAQDAEMDDEAG